MARLRLPVLVLLAGCALDNRLGDGGPGNLDFTIGTVSLHVASGGVKRSGNVLALYLSDQPDACLAVTNVPVGTATTLALKVAPRDDGSTTATVGPRLTVPGPGQAVGSLSAQTGGTRSAYYDVASGTAAWTVNASGSVTIDGLDLGFDGADGRLTLGALTVPACP